VGNVEKCSYCGGPVEKQTDKRFDTTIIENLDFLSKLTPAAANEPTAQQFQAQLPQPTPATPVAPAQARPRPVPLNPQQVPGPQPAKPYAQPQAQPPMQPRIPSNPLPQQFPGRPTPPVTGQPVQQIPMRPASLPGQQQAIIPQQGIPMRPAAQQPPVSNPSLARPVQAVPIHPATPVQQGNIPQAMRPSLAQQPPQRIAPQPVQPRPVTGGPAFPAPPAQPRPISPVPLQQPPGPNIPGIQPQQGIHIPPAPPAANFGVPKPSSQDGIIKPTGSPVPSSPGIAPYPQNPQQAVRPVPVPLQSNVPPRPISPASPAGEPFSASFIPPSVHPQTEKPLYESGIDIKPAHDEMEVLSSGDYIASQGNQFDFSSHRGNDNDSLPPAFARAREEGTNLTFQPKTEGGTPRTGGAGQWEADGFPFGQEEKKKGPYISEHKEHSGNEVTYKIISIAITIIAFFSLRIIDTLRIGVSNPYDKIFFIRLLIFGMIFSFTGYMLFVKNLGKKETLVKTIIIILLVVGFIGSFIGISGISTSADSNFFVADAEAYYRLMDNPKGQAKNPAFSPSGKMAVMNYAPNNMLENTIHLLKINLDNEEKPAEIVEMPVTCNKQMYWYSASEIIFPGLKISPTEAFRFELLDANTGNVNTIYSSYEYNFSTDFDYSRSVKKIAGAFANLIWILDPEGGELMPVTGLDILARQYENTPPASDFTLNPMGFLSSLKDNRVVITEMPYLDTSPRFAPDGKAIYFVRTDPANPNNSNICRVNLENLTNAEKLSGLKTSADLMDFLMNSTEVLTPEPTAYGQIAVSPGSRFVVCWVRARKGDSPNISMNENALVIFDTYEKTLIRIFPTYPTEAYINQLDWSPDGKYLIADMSAGINSIIIMIEVPAAIVKMDEQAIEN
jgi:hypothetical protein